MEWREVVACAPNGVARLETSKGISVVRVQDVWDDGGFVLYAERSLAVGSRIWISVSPAPGAPEVRFAAEVQRLMPPGVVIHILGVEGRAATRAPPPRNPSFHPPIRSGIRAVPALTSVPARDAAVDAPPDVLIVEDDPTQVRLLQAWLGELGRRVVAAVTGADAIEHMRRFRNSIDVIIVDSLLPDTTGRDLIPKLRAQAIGRSPKVFSVSGVLIGRSSEQGCLDAGADEFLEKPLSRDVVCGLVGPGHPSSSIQPGPRRSAVSQLRTIAAGKMRRTG